MAQKIFRKPLPQPPRSKTLSDDTGLDGWLRLLPGLIPQITIYQPVFDLANIAANTVSSQTFTLTGLSVNDFVIVNPPLLSAGLLLSANSKATADERLLLVLQNTTGGGIDEASATFTVVTIGT